MATSLPTTLFKRQPRSLLSFVYSHRFRVSPLTHCASTPLPSLPPSGSLPIYCFSDKLRCSTNRVKSLDNPFKPMKTLPSDKLLTTQKSFMEIYDNIPLLGVSGPCGDGGPWARVNLPNRNNTVEIADPAINHFDIVDPAIRNSDIVEPEINPADGGGGMRCKNNHVRRQRTRMNTHQHKKRRKRDRITIREVHNIREFHRKIKQAAVKEKMIKKIEKITADDPNSEYLKRAYVQYRLKNW